LRETGYVAGQNVTVEYRPRSSVMNSRRLMSGFPAQSVCRALSLPQSERRVLWAGPESF
jgi:hypothetical protein